MGVLQDANFDEQPFKRCTCELYHHLVSSYHQIWRASIVPIAHLAYEVDADVRERSITSHCIVAKAKARA